MKSSRGCWTCRLRRKKCDEREPICAACAKLEIKCHYQQGNKPEWMDGGDGQAEMAEQVKREIKIKARRRRGEPPFQVSSDFVRTPSDLPQATAPATPTHHDHYEAPTETYSDIVELISQGSISWPQQGLQLEQNERGDQEVQAFEGSDAVLSLFYLEKVLPFLFPFYSPSLLQGGKAWILEMIIRRPAIRQAILCQSFYFSVACGGVEVGDVNWEGVLTQAKSAFWTLRESLKVIDNLDIGGNLGCTVRIMASIMQVHRFEISVLSFENWQTHLNAVVGLFRQLLEGDSDFNAIMERLGPPVIFPSQTAQLPNAEQAAFRFSSALVILDDIIASTTLQRQPRLYVYHRSLLCDDIEDVEPPVNLASVFGVQNWALRLIGEIATLEAWKLECRRVGILDVLKLAHAATAIKESLMAHLADVENRSRVEVLNPPNLFTQPDLQPSHRCLITRIWAHAALLYLFIVTSGWQPANGDVRYHVNRVIQLSYQIFPQALLRTAVWPFCVAGCLAEPAQETEFRQLMRGLTPPTLFGQMHKALEVMENAWETRAVGDVATRDLATCFRSLEDPILPV